MLEWFPLAVTVILLAIEAALKNPDSKKKYKARMLKVRDAITVAYPEESGLLSSSYWEKANEDPEKAKLIAEYAAEHIGKPDKKKEQPDRVKAAIDGWS